MGEAPALPRLPGQPPTSPQGKSMKINDCRSLASAESWAKVSEWLGGNAKRTSIKRGYSSIHDKPKKDGDPPGGLWLLLVLGSCAPYFLQDAAYLCMQYILRVYISIVPPTIPVYAYQLLLRYRFANLILHLHIHIPAHYSSIKVNQCTLSQSRNSFITWMVMVCACIHAFTYLHACM